MAVLELQRKIYPGVNFSDADFRIENTGLYELNIFLNDSQFLFNVVDTANHSVKHIQSFNFFQVNNSKDLVENLNAVFDSEDLLNHPYKEVNFAIYSDYNTLIPAAHFDPASLNDYLFFNFDRDDEPLSFYNELRNADAVNVFGLDRMIQKVLEKKFESVNITHASSHLLNHLLGISANDSESVLYVYVQPKIVQVACIHKNKLRHFNSFYYSTPEDFIYYILYSCQHLQLDPENVQLVLLGEIVKDSVLYEYTYKYIRNVQFGQRPANVKIDAAFKMPSHFYYNLFCMGL